MKRLKKSLTFSIGLLCFIIGANNAYAGYYADQLSQCLVKNTDEEDRKSLAKWIFSVIAQHPDIKEFTSITPEQQKAIEKTAIDLFARLITQDCRSEFISVIKYEPEQGIFISFKTLGEVSMMTLMTNPVVQEAAVNFSQQLDSNGAIEKLIEQTKTQ